MDSKYQQAIDLAHASARLLDACNRCGSGSAHLQALSQRFAELAGTELDKYPVRSLPNTPLGDGKYFNQVPTPEDPLGVRDRPWFDLPAAQVVSP